MEVLAKFKMEEYRSIKFLTGVTNTMRAKIVIPKREAKLIQSLLNLSGNEIYDKYGLHQYDSITHTVRFDDGVEADIRLVICAGEEAPYTEGILYIDGAETCVTEPQDTYDGEWYFEYYGEEYYVNVVFEEDPDDREYISFFAYTNKVQYNECDKNS